MLGVSVIAALCVLAVAKVPLVKKDDDCCAPTQWEGTLGFTLAVNDDDKESALLASEAQVSVDHVGQRFLITYADDYVSPDEPDRKSLLIWFAFDEETSRIYETKKDGSCEYFTLPRTPMPSNCMSELGYFFLERYNMGLDIGVKSYISETGTFLILQESNCVPLSATAGENEEGRQRLLLGGSKNLSGGIKDDSVFTPAENCTPAYKMPNFANLL